MQRYGKAAAKAIIQDYCHQFLDVTDDGVRLSETCLEFDTSRALHWKYACELDGPDAPDPLEAPSLPIPFSANELAAFMLDGVGAVIPSVYGGWEDGPYEEMLDEMGVLAKKAREALRAAYGAIRDAETVVGKHDRALEIRAGQLAEEYEQQNLEANTREGVFVDGLAREEARARRERAAASVDELKERFRLVEAQQKLAFSKWRKAMVNQLLHASMADDEQFAGSGGMLLVKLEREDCVKGAFVKIGGIAGAIARANGSHNPRDAERKMFARVNAGVQLKFLNPLDPEHFTPLSRDDYGMGIVPFAELVEWGHATTLFDFKSEFISPAVGTNARRIPQRPTAHLEPSLRAQVLDMVHRRLLGLAVSPLWASAEYFERPYVPAVAERIGSPNPAEASDAERRLAKLRALGGTAKFRQGEWKFLGISVLVKSEKEAGRKRADEKTIRADLREAAGAERDAKQAGPLFGGMAKE